MMWEVADQGKLLLLMRYIVMLITVDVMYRVKKRTFLPFKIVFNHVVSF